MKANWGLPVLVGSGLLLAQAGAAPAGETSLSGSTNRPGAAVESNSYTNGLRLNLRGAPLRQVLEFLGRAAGLVIQQKADLRGNLTVWSEEPLQREDAVKVLCAALKQNGYAVLREGRTLTIVSAEQAKTADLKVLCGNDPETVEASDEVALQIIPVRYASASQLLNNLQLLLPTSATLSANESANALLLVATQNEIRRALRIVQTLDTALATTCSVRVFALRYADAKELASVLQQLFASSSQSQSTTLAAQNAPGSGPGPGGGGFGPPGPPELAAAQTASSSSSGSAARAKVTIAADERSNSLVVSAPAETLTILARTIEECDQQATDATVLRRFRLRNADPTELADQLSQLFSSSSSSTDQSQPTPNVTGPPLPPELGGGPPGSEAAGAASSTSTHRRQQSQVLAVADPRTSSLLVSAGSRLMPQIAKLIAQLDDSPGRKEVVRTFDLRYADPQDIYQTLQDLFNRTGGTRTSNNGNSLLGQGNPLSTRQTQQQSSTTTGSSGFGNTGSMGSSASASGGSSSAAQ